MKNIIRKYIQNPLVQNMAVYAASNGIAAAMPFLVFPVVAYYLTTEEFGLVTNYQVLIQITSIFSGLSASAYFAVDYHKAGDNLRSTYNNIHYFVFILFLLAGILVLVLNESITDTTELATRWIFLAVFSIPFIMIKGLFLTRLRMEERARFFGVFNSASAILSAGLTLLFIVVLGMGWNGRIYGLFLATFVGGVVAFTLNAKYIGKFHKPDLEQMKRLLIFGLPLLPHKLSIWLRTGFEKLFITEAVSLASNGVYSFAVNINLIFTLLSGAFFSAFSPYVYKKLALAEADDEINIDRVKLGIVKKTYVFLIVYFGFLILGYFGSWMFIEILFKDKYIEALDYLPYLLVYNFFNTCYIFVSMVIFYSKSTKYLGLITIFSALIQVLLMIFLVEKTGPVGAAISAMAVSVITLISVYFYSNKVYPMPWLKIHEVLGIKLNKES